MEDSGSWFPLPLLREQARQGRIGKLARRFHGAPTNRSQRHTLEIDCPDILARCQKDCTTAAVLVPNCPVCHHTLSLFCDFPLGNAAGKPHGKLAQALTLGLALKVLESAPAARTTVQSPQRWSDEWQWKPDYCNAERCSPQELARLRDEAMQASATARSIKAGL